VTFGCFNNFCKVNEQVLELWARVLGAVEGSRLLLLAPKGSRREEILGSLRSRAVDVSRVEFVSKEPRRSYLDWHHRVDIILDTFPYNGHTTNLDALWMGVPVVSLVGKHAVSRAGFSQLSNLGLTELAAFSQDDYVKIATQLAHDLPRLAQLRTTLRGRMQASPLMDAPGFARGVEAAYREMWQRWCAR
jgi:predicted O-linked N-acetylglucosamine transferase (SPINDLY family)